MEPSFSTILLALSITGFEKKKFICVLKMLHIMLFWIFFSDIQYVIVLIVLTIVWFIHMIRYLKVNEKTYGYHLVNTEKFFPSYHIRENHITLRSGIFFLTCVHVCMHFWDALIGTCILLIFFFINCKSLITIM